MSFYWRFHNCCSGNILTEWQTFLKSIFITFHSSHIAFITLFCKKNDIFYFTNSKLTQCQPSVTESKQFSLLIKGSCGWVVEFAWFFHSKLQNFLNWPVKFGKIFREKCGPFEYTALVKPSTITSSWSLSKSVWETKIKFNVKTRLM